MRKKDTILPYNGILFNKCRRTDGNRKSSFTITLIIVAGKNH